MTDENDGTAEVEETAEARRGMNRIRCAKCRELLHSKHRHDWVTCKCGAVYVDGGNDYRRTGGSIEDIIIVRDDDTEIPMTECMTL